MMKGTAMIIQTYRELENEIRKYNRIAIFGAGEWGKIYTYAILRNAALRVGKKIDCFYDNLLAPGTIVKEDVTVHPIEELYEHNTDLLLFVGVGTKLRGQILEQMQDHHISHVIVSDDIFFAQICQSIEMDDCSIRDEYRSLMDDSIFLKAVYEQNMGVALDLRNPESYNAKLNWLKIYDHNPLYTLLADKYSVKEYVASIIGWEYIIPTLGIYNCWEEINFDTLPKRFVLKCTHDAGSTIAVRDKDCFDRGEAQRAIEKFLKRNYYWMGREWPYKNIIPKIIVEPFLYDNKMGIRESIYDYKFFCYAGKIKYVFVATGRQRGQSGLRIDFFDQDFQHLPDEHKKYPNAEAIPQKPEHYELMRSLVVKLAKEFTFVRVDLYYVNQKIYFGEYTFYPGGGMEPYPDLLGEAIKLV